MSGIPISRRSFLTVSTAIGLSGLYGVYAHVVDAVLTSASNKLGSNLVSPQQILPPKKAREIADRWLPSQPWVARAAYQLRTNDDQTFIYFEEWEPTDSDMAVRLRPFALVWMPDGQDSDEEPIRIISDSAYFRFTSEFSLTGGSPGRVTAGSLEGNVRVQGKDGMDVVGKNFVFSESAMRVYSDDHVKFAHGLHRGHALGLQIELIPDTTADPNDAMAVAGIKSVQLRRNVVMDLMLEEQLPTAQDKPRQPRADAKPPTPVTIHSAGSFTFNTETNVAMYEEEVRVLKPVEPEGYDTLECEKLTLFFEPDEQSPQDVAKKPAAAESASTSDGEEPGFQGIAANLTFRRLLAEGKDVLLTSGVNNLRAHMGKLEYDAQSRVAVLTDEKSVRVRQETNELTAPEITLIHDEAGSIDSVRCRGAGQLKFRDPQTGEIQLHAKWVKQLRKYSDPQSELEIIELEQQALVRQAVEESELAAEFIKLWIEPQDKRGDAASTDAVVSAAGTTGGDSTAAQSADPSTRVNIDRLLALKKVAMTSPGMHAKTDRLEIWFEEADLPPQVSQQKTNTSVGDGTPMAVSQSPPQPSPSMRSGASGPSQSEQRPESENTREAESSVHAVSATATPPGLGEVLFENPFAPEPTLPTGGVDSGSTAKAKPTNSPTVVVADLIQVRVLQDNRRKETQVAEIWTLGNVEVTHQHTADEPPLRITGDRLYMQNHDENGQVVHVYGQPAHIYDRQSQIEGGNIHLDRGKNLTWVDGEGVLRLPVNNSLEGEPLETPEILDIGWKEKMNFDGETARFYGDVQTLMKASRMRCQEMKVMLTQRISFASADPDVDRNDPQVKIRQIQCKEGVDIEGREYVEEKLVELRRARFWELTLNQVTGETTASGPGWLTVWRRGDGNRAKLSPIATVQANKPVQSGTAEWEYSRIDFAGQTHGNMKQRTTTFNDRVLIVHGPIGKPLESIDPDDLPENGGWMRCDSLRLTQFKKTQTRPTFIKMLGEGNAYLEGRMSVRDSRGSRGENFRARADTISFDESKGLYILRSRGNRVATIWRQKQLGGDYSQHDARRMEFTPAINKLRSDFATGTIGIE